MSSENDQVCVAYQFFDDQGQQLDSSEESGLLCFQFGDRTVLPAIEEALQGAAVGQRIELDLPPHLAFGEHRPELVFEAVRENLPPDAVLEPGTELYTGSDERNPFRLRVIKATAQGALLDGNHPFAGKHIKASLTVVAEPCNQPTPEAE